MHGTADAAHQFADLARHRDRPVHQLVESEQAVAQLLEMFVRLFVEGSQQFLIQIEFHNRRLRRHRARVPGLFHRHGADMGADVFDLGQKSGIVKGAAAADKLAIALHRIGGAAHGLEHGGIQGHLSMLRMLKRLFQALGQSRQPANAQHAGSPPDDMHQAMHLIQNRPIVGMLLQGDDTFPDNGQIAFHLIHKACIDVVLFVRHQFNLRSWSFPVKAPCIQRLAPLPDLRRTPQGLALQNKNPTRLLHQHTPDKLQQLGIGGPLFH